VDLDSEVYDGAVVLEPHEDFGSCCIGIVDDPDVRLVYDYDRIVEMFMERDGMSREEAQEWVDFNTVRAIAYMGDRRPVLVYAGA
jgi:GMP synthase PP-ATPase subunit